MEEQASFETRAVLAPRRTRLARLALLVPVVAFVAITWAGVNGDRSDLATVDNPEPTAGAAPTLTVLASTASAAPVGRRTERPAQAVGIDVQRLGDIRPHALGRDDIVAISGWYVPTAITDCPPLDAIYRDGALPNVRGDIDTWAFCVRSGLLYPSQPDRDMYAPLSAVPVTVVVGVIMPIELETVGTGATEVIVLGRFIESTEGCPFQGACRPRLVVDHVAWTPDA